MTHPSPHPLPLARRELLALAVLGLLPPSVRAAVFANQRELRVLATQDAASVRQITQALKARYVHVVSEAEASQADTRRLPAVYLALGSAAAQQALEGGAGHTAAPLVAALVSSLNYRQLVTGADAPGRDRAAMTAIYTDAAPQEQMHLIACIFERHVTVGVPLSDATAHLERSLRLAAEPHGIELVFTRLTPGTDIVRALARISGTQALLALPDSKLYTADTLRLVLESTYRRGLPVIGFSSAAVAAGTLATCHATIDDVLTDLLSLLDAQLRSGSPIPLPEARHPRYWRVAVNQNVARSLGISLSDKVLGLGNPAPQRSAG